MSFSWDSWKKDIQTIGESFTENCILLDTSS